MTPDDAALEAEILALTRKFGAKVHGIASYFARDEHDTEDLMQEIWARAIEVRARGPLTTSPEAWLTLLAMNVAREWRRNRYGWSDFKARGLRFFAIDREIHASGGETAEIDIAVQDRVWRAVEALPPLQREVVVLRVLGGMSTVQAANAIDRAEGTVKTSLSRALETLRSKLADLEDVWTRGTL